jgi:hypothetical protein
MIQLRKKPREKVLNEIPKESTDQSQISRVEQKPSDRTVHAREKRKETFERDGLH